MANAHGEESQKRRSASWEAALVLDIGFARVALLRSRSVRELWIARSDETSKRRFCRRYLGRCLVRLNSQAVRPISGTYSLRISLLNLDHELELVCSGSEGIGVFLKLGRKISKTVLSCTWLRAIALKICANSCEEADNSYLFLRLLNQKEILFSPFWPFNVTQGAKLCTLLHLKCWKIAM